MTRDAADRTSIVEWIEKNGYLDDVENGGGMTLARLQPHQKRILLDVTSRDERGRFPFTTVVYSCPKKSGKTSLCGLYTLWFAWNEGAPTEIFVLANDQEQAQGRIFSVVWKSMWASPAMRSLLPGPIPGKTHDRIVFPNGTFIQTLPNDAATAAGSNHSLTVWSELWAYTSDRSQQLWDELTPVPTRRNSIRFVETYAGTKEESRILWQLYTQVVKPENLLYPDGFEVDGRQYDWQLPVYVDMASRTYIYWDEQQRMPWQTDNPEYYEEQKKSLHIAAFLRLHKNLWISSQNAFVTEEMWQACEREHDDPIWQLAKGLPETVACDASTKKDHTVMVSVAYEPTQGLYFLKWYQHWQPENDNILQRVIVDLEETIKAKIIAQYRARNINGVYYDPYQLHSIATTLEKQGYEMFEFPQLGMRIKADNNLYDLIAQKRLIVYPAPDLKAHVLNAKTKMYDEGKMRLTKGGQGVNKIDLGVTLSMACYGAEERWREGPKWVTVPFLSTASVAATSAAVKGET